MLCPTPKSCVAGVAAWIHATDSRLRTGARIGPGTAVGGNACTGPETCRPAEAVAYRNGGPPCDTWVDAGRGAG